MKLQYDVSGPNNSIDLILLNHATTDAVRYAETGDYNIVSTKLIQSTVSNEFTICFRMEITLTEKEKC